MKMKDKQVKLNNELQLTVKSVSEKETDKLSDFMCKVYSETEFMARTQAEVSDLNKKQFQTMIEDCDKSKKSIMLAAYDNDNIVGYCIINPISENSKESHRATFSIAVIKDMWRNGLGSILLNIAMDFAGKVGFEQVELDTVTENVNALMLYKKFGFETVAFLPHAQKLENGAYYDYFRLIKYLNKNEA